MEQFAQIKVIFENSDYLVIDKPAGLAVHGGGNIKEKTLADWLADKYPEIALVGEDPLRPGIVHRLDREVSGLMVVARNNESFKHLKNQFKDRDINKEYVALAHGQMLNDFGTINFPIKRAKDGYKMAAMPLNTFNLLSRRHPTSRDQGNLDGIFKAREAITEYSVIKKLVNFTLLDVKILTGRTHQIRVHFFALGHPLVGDNLYSNKKSKIQNKKIGLNRIFLFAKALSFKDRKGEVHHFELKMPQELTEILKSLK